MKKLFLSLFVAGALTFGLQSCGEEETNTCEGVTCAANETCQDGTCVPNATTCDVCMWYLRWYGRRSSFNSINWY